MKPIETADENHWDFFRMGKKKPINHELTHVQLDVENKPSMIILKKMKRPINLRKNPRYWSICQETGEIIGGKIEEIIEENLEAQENAE